MAQRVLLSILGDTMKWMMLTGSLAACGSALAAHSDDAQRDQIRMETRMLDSAYVPTAATPNTCGSAPLPLTPRGPVVNGTFKWGTKAPNNVVAWRYPCSATESMIVLTVTPTNTGSPSILCGASLQLLQSGGLQTTALYLRGDPGSTSSFCTDVVSAVTVAIIPTSSTPAAFDFDQATTIDFDGASAGHQTISIGAYNPANYNLTPPPGSGAVNVYVRGANVGFRNCAVTQSGSQYTASCASEVPTMANGFDAYPSPGQ